MAQPHHARYAGLRNEFERLGREAAVLAARLEAAQTAAQDALGRDPSGQVEVELTPEGRVASVRVANLWRSRLTADGLGDAVLAACRAAEDSRLESWAVGIGRSRHQADASRSAPSWTAPAPLTDSGLLAGQDAIRGLWHLLQDASDRIEDLTQEAATRSRAVVTGTDQQHRVTATFTGGALTGLDVDQRWAAQARGTGLGAAITDAVAHGYAEIDRRAEESLLQRWPFPELQRLTGDPATLLATLGFPSPPRREPRQEGA